MPVPWRYTQPTLPKVQRGCFMATTDAGVVCRLINLDGLSLHDLEQQIRQSAVVAVIAERFRSPDRDPDDLAAPFQNYV